MPVSCPGLAVARQRGENMNITYIDGVNWVKRTVQAANGTIELQGMTVRAMRKLLEDADPEAMVIYCFEQNDTLMFGVMAGAGVDNSDVCLFFGPEGCKGILGENRK